MSFSTIELLFDVVQPGPPSMRALFPTAGQRYWWFTDPFGSQAMDFEVIGFLKRPRKCEDV